MIIAGYERISVDIEMDKDNTSIENQKRIIEDFVREKFPVADLIHFEDRDRSGYTFAQREGYQNMRKKLMSGEIKTLIVKDFSRFSRRNSLGLWELELLRDAGVRIISVGDAIDYPTKDDWMLIQFKFLMNEFPVTDTSKKIKAIIKNRQKNGDWVCAVPYGYRITNTKDMTYEIDPTAADIVRMIFDLYNEGWGYKKIANHLTDNGIPTPRAHEIAWRESQGKATKLKAKTEWNTSTISGMLHDDFYIGTLRQKKTRREKINGSSKPVDDEDQIVIENAHTPIIDFPTFTYTQRELEMRTRANYRGEKKYPTEYSSFLYCGDCGSPMFSMSRPNLSPAYRCGTYHQRGLKGCTSHHIRVDKLDELLKRYIKQVAANAGSMMQELEDAIREQPHREEEIGNVIEQLDRQLSDAKEQLKGLYKRKLLDSINKSVEEATIVEETYKELESDLLFRIRGLEAQINDNIDLRNQVIHAAKKAKTVQDVFTNILEKDRLTKHDIGMIVERIDVYETHIDIRLLADVDALINAGVREDPVNFPDGSRDISNFQIVQSAKQRPDKVFAVNVINEGDPLEIYTSRDGEVIFKKYSLMGGVEEFAAQICETLNKSTGVICAVSDRDTIVAIAGGARRELLGKRISSELERVLDNRRIYQYQDGGTPIPAGDGNDTLMTLLAAPILSEGDLFGAVLMIAQAPMPATGETEYKLAQTIASFLGRHMES